MALNVDFKFKEHGIGAEDIRTEAEKIIRQTKETEEVRRNSFPIDAFPDQIQQIILDTNESLHFPTDFIGSSLLYAGGLAIGNTHVIKAKNTWHESAVLFLSIVGKPGSNKSHPVSFALQPFFDRDKRTFKDYEQQKQEYDYAMSLSKKEREREGLGEPTKPVWNKTIVSDFTPEALTEVHKFNIRGVGVYADELAGWFKNFNRYNNGSEETFWLSTWSCKPINIDRKSGDPIFINKPFVPVIGSIQNGVLKELSGNSRSQNGFIDRILFAFPEQLKKPHWNEEDLSPSVIESWDTIISNLLNIQCDLDDTGNPVPEILKFTPEAKMRFKEWFNENADISNATEDETLQGISAKLTTYLLRFSLIIELLQWACGESEKQGISIQAVEGAIKLTKYFRETALKVHRITANPLEQLPKDKQDLYLALPDIFTTSEGLVIAEALSVPKDTFHKFLRRHKKDLFEQSKVGEYHKLF